LARLAEAWGRRAEVGGLRSEVSSPAAEIDPAEDDFAIAGVDQRVHLANDPIGRKRTALTADVGNHAEGTAVVAAVLNFQVGAGAFIGGIEDGSSQEFGVSEDIGDENRPFVARRWSLAIGLRKFRRPCHRIKRNKRARRLNRRAALDRTAVGGCPHMIVLSGARQRDLRQLMLVRVADDMSYARQPCDLFGGALRVATGDDNAGLRIPALNAADGRARILIGGSGDGTSIEYDDGSLAGIRGARETEFLELAFESGAVGLGGAATEILYVISGHVLMVTHPGGLIGRSQPSRARSHFTGRRAARDQAEAAVLRDWKHSRQNTGRPCVGRKGTVVSFPHPEQMAWVSTLV